MSIVKFDPQNVEIFGGRQTLNERSECPPGMSPNCSDVVFKKDAVMSRVGLALRLTDASGVNSLKNFMAVDRQRRLVVFENNGVLYTEYPEGKTTRIDWGATDNAPSMIAAGAYMKSVYFQNRLWMCFSDGKRPMDYPWQYDPIANGNWLNGLLFAATPAAPSGDRLTVADGAAGVVAAGYRSVFITFEDRYGFTTGQSAVVSYTATGAKKMVITHVPVAPNTTTDVRGPFVKSRVWCTVAGGLGSFYSIGAFVTDNSGASLTLDFTDASLLTGRIWDPSMTETPIPPAIGVMSYNSRLAFWGVYNRAPNVLALLSDAGSTQPTNGQFMGMPCWDFSNVTSFDPTLGGPNPRWVAPTAASAGNVKLANMNSVAMPYGFEGTHTHRSVVMVGTGGANQPSIRITMESRVTFANADPLYYVEPGQKYQVLIRMMIPRSAGTVTNWGVQTVTVSMGGPMSTAATRTFSYSDVSKEIWSVYEITAGSEILANGTPLYVDVTPSGAWFGALAIDWAIIVPAASKFDGSSLYWTNYTAPSVVDLVKGIQPINPGDGEEIRCVFEQTGNTYIVKERSTWVTSDNGQDPSGWPIDNVSKVVGTASIHGVGIGPDFAVIASEEGLYYFDSGKMEKVSQEIQADWDLIDYRANGHLIWVTVDPRLKQVRVGVPITGQIAHKIYVLDYMQGWEDGSDNAGRGRKWSIDTVDTRCAEMAYRDSGSQRMVYGGSRAAGNYIPATALPPAGWTFTGTATLGVVAFAGDARPLASMESICAAPAVAVFGATVAGTARLSYSTALTNAVGDYCVISFWGKDGNPTGPLPVIVVKDPYGVQDQAVYLTSTWTRFVAVFGPCPAAGGATKIDLDFGTLTVAPQSSIGLAGWSVQSGRYDQGWFWPGFGGTAINYFSQESGFISQPIEGLSATPSWNTFDWDGIITSIYEFAPFGMKLGRSVFDKMVARVRGSGLLEAYWVRPDNTTTPVHGGMWKNLSSSPNDDVEYGGNQQDTFIGVRLRQAAAASWFVLKRFGLFSKGHESATFRSK